MRRIDPLALVALGLFALLAALAVATGGTGATGSGPTLRRSASIYDDSPGGASVLRRYFEAVGRTVVAVRGERFAPTDAGVTTLFLLGTTDPIEPADLAALHDFVRAGGTLVIATDLGLNERRLRDDFGVPLRGGMRPGAGPGPPRSAAATVGPGVRARARRAGPAFGPWRDRPAAAARRPAPGTGLAERPRPADRFRTRRRLGRGREPRARGGGAPARRRTRR